MHAFVAYVFASVHVNVRARARVGACARAHEKDVGLHVFARVCVWVWYRGDSDPEE